MEKFLPLWIVGAPLLWAIFDWFSTPKGTGDRTVYRSTGVVGDRSVLAGR